MDADGPSDGQCWMFLVHPPSDPAVHPVRLMTAQWPPGLRASSWAWPVKATWGSKGRSSTSAEPRPSLVCGHNLPVPLRVPGVLPSLACSRCFPSLCCLSLTLSRPLYINPPHYTSSGPISFSWSHKQDYHPLRSSHTLIHFFV